MVSGHVKNQVEMINYARSSSGLIQPAIHFNKPPLYALVFEKSCEHCRVKKIIINLEMGKRRRRRKKGDFIGSSHDLKLPS